MFSLGHQRTFVAVVALAAAVVALLGPRIGLSQTPAAPAVPTTARPASSVCLECHAGRDTTLAPTPHTVNGKDGHAARVACIDCHTGDPQHWEGDPTTYPMSNPSQQKPLDEAATCRHCHQSSHQQNVAEKNAHTVNGVNCSGCHTVHVSRAARGLLAKPEPGLCYGCHADVQGHFAKPYRHPVDDGVLVCSDCHRTLDVARRELTTRGESACARCHAALVGPFVYEHPATLGFSTGENGCVTCHDPHGSALPRMTRQPYEPPHFQLCTQCHAIPKHNANVMHGTRWAGVPCNDCHVDVHGSNVSRNLLDPALQAQGCFNSGCHRF